MELINGYCYIPVSDIEKAAEWYKKIFGFKTVNTVNSVNKDPYYYELRSPSGIRILLIEIRGVNSHLVSNEGPQAAYGFTVKDAEAAYSELLSKNVGVMKIVDNQGKSFEFYDLDGNIIELWEEEKQ